jgi:hypothetical protein
MLCIARNDRPDYRAIFRAIAARFKRKRSYIFNDLPCTGRSVRQTRVRFITAVSLLDKGRPLFMDC